MWAGVAACVALHLAFICQGVTRPWLHDFDGINGSLFSVGARNMVRYGMVATGFGCATEPGRDGRPPERYYATHPPLLPVMVAASFKVFGTHEWAARLVPIAFSAAAVILVFLNAARVMGPAGSLSAAAVYAMLPMMGFYGRMVGYEIPTTTLILLAAWLAQLYFAHGGRGRLVGVLAALTAAQLADWPGYLAVAGVVAAALMVRAEAPHAVRLALAAPVTGLLTFTVVIGQLVALAGGGGRLLETVWLKTSIVERSFTAAEFVGRNARRFVGLFTPTALLLGGLALAPGVGPPRRRGLTVPLVMVTTPAMLNLLVFTHGIWHHHYWLYYFGPPLALLCGLAVERCTAASPLRRRRGLTALCLLLMVGTLPLSVLAVRNLHGRPSMDDYHEIMQLRQVVGPSANYAVVATHCMVPWYMDGTYRIADDPRSLAAHLRDLPPPQFVAVHPSHMDWAEPILQGAGYEREHRWQAYRTVFYFPTKDAPPSEALPGPANDAGILNPRGEMGVSGTGASRLTEVGQ